METVLMTVKCAASFSPTIHKELMIPHEAPSLPWETVRVDYIHSTQQRLRVHLNGLQKDYASGILKMHNTQYFITVELQ